MISQEKGVPEKARKTGKLEKRGIRQHIGSTE